MNSSRELRSARRRQLRSRAEDHLRTTLISDTIFTFCTILSRVFEVGMADADRFLAERYGAGFQRDESVPDFGRDPCWR